MPHISQPRALRGLACALALCLSLTGPAPAQTAAPADGAEVRICGGYPAPAVPDLAPLPASDGTHEVATAFGAVDLPLAPGAALGMYTTDVDILIWLGYPLAASQPIRGGGQYTTLPCFFPQKPLAGIAAFGNYPEYDYEKILLARPDFILNGLGYDEAVVKRLPQIAPTFSVNAFDGRSWQDHFRETAEALGRPERYQAWLDVYQARLAEVREQIKARADAVVTPLSIWDGKYVAGCYTGVQCTVFRDLGLTIFPGALENDGEGLELSLEEASRFEGVDYAFMSVGIGEAGMAEHKAVLAEAAKNPVWTKLGFVAADHIVPFELEMVYGSPSGQLAFLEVVAQVLGN